MTIRFRSRALALMAFALVVPYGAGCGASGSATSQAQAVEQARNYIEQWANLLVLAGSGQPQTRAKAAAVESTLAKNPHVVTAMCAGNKVWNVKWPSFTAVAVGKHTAPIFASLCGSGF